MIVASRRALRDRGRGEQRGGEQSRSSGCSRRLLFGRSPFLHRPARAGFPAAAAERTSAASRSATGRPPTRSRPRAARACAARRTGASAVEACVIRAGCSIRLSTPPRLSASWKIFVRATSATASSSDSARNETMPPKSRIWRAAIAWPGCDGQARVEHAARRAGAGRGTPAIGVRVLAVLAHPHGERLQPAQHEPAVERPRHRAERLLQEVAGARRPSGRSWPTKPPMRSEWPPRYFVVEWTTTSAPSSSGCCRYGRGERVVDDDQRADRVRGLGGGADVDDVQERVGRRLEPDDPRPLVEVRGEVRRSPRRPAPSRSRSPSARRPARTSGRRRRRRRRPPRRGRPG